MLKGRILSIQFTGGWVVTLDGHRKEFKYWEEIRLYLKMVLEKSKDQKKKELLREDFKKLWTN